MAESLKHTRGERHSGREGSGARQKRGRGMNLLAVTVPELPVLPVTPGEDLPVGGESHGVSPPRAHGHLSHHIGTEVEQESGRRDVCVAAHAEATIGALSTGVHLREGERGRGRREERGRGRGREEREREERRERERERERERGKGKREGEEGGDGWWRGEEREREGEMRGRGREEIKRKGERREQEGERGRGKMKGERRGRGEEGGENFTGGVSQGERLVIYLEQKPTFPSCETMNRVLEPPLI